MDANPDLTEVLSLLQLSDSAFPAGRYVHSYALEAFAQNGWLTVPTRPSILRDLLSDSIRLSTAPSDGAALACAHRAVERNGDIDVASVGKVDRRLTACKLASEMRSASERSGRALLRASAPLVGAGIADYERLVEGGNCPGNHAVVLGLVSAVLGVPAPLAVTGELYAFSASWVAAATRLGLTDHLVAQAILHQVKPILSSSAMNAMSMKLDDISSCTPSTDLMSMRHEQAEIRLFAS